MAYRDFKDLTTRTASDIILCYKAFNIAKNHKYDWYQRSLASMIYKCFDKLLLRRHRQRCYGQRPLLHKIKFAGSGIKNESISKKELVEEFHQTIIWNLKKRRVKSLFIGNIWGADLADMQLKEFVYYMLLIFTVNMPGLFLWKISEVLKLLMAKILNESNCKPNKIWVDKGSKFYKR